MGAGRPHLPVSGKATTKSFISVNDTAKPLIFGGGGAPLMPVSAKATAKSLILNDVDRPLLKVRASIDFLPSHQGMTPQSDASA